jgi:hypothetical protein
MFYRIFLVCYCKDCICLGDPHIAEHRKKIEMVQRRAARYACNRYHNTSSITDMLQTLTWPTLQRRLKTKLIMFYKIVHHIVAVPTTILIFKNQTISSFYIQTSSCIQRFIQVLILSEHNHLLPQNIVLCPTVNTFREQLTPTVLNHLQSQI